MGPAARASSTTAPQFQSSSNAASTPARRDRASARPYARGPFHSHVNPMRCAWATLPTCTSRGLCAYQRVNAHVQGFAYKRHTTRDTTAPKTQTTSPTTLRFQCFSSRWSALWAPHHLTSRPRRHQTGGNDVIRTTTRRRHAASQPLMLQNPHRHRRGGHRRDRRARAAAPERSEGRAAGRGARGRRDLTFLKSRMQFDWVKIQQGLKRCDFNAVNSELEIVAGELHARLVSQV